MSRPVYIQISVATILTHACKTREHQNLLAEFGVVDGCVRTLLAASPGHSDVQVPALKLLAFLVFRYVLFSKPSPNIFIGVRGTYDIYMDSTVYEVGTQNYSRFFVKVGYTF